MTTSMKGQAILRRYISEVLILVKMGDILQLLWFLLVFLIVDDVAVNGLV